MTSKRYEQKDVSFASSVFILIHSNCTLEGREFQALLNDFYILNKQSNCHDGADPDYDGSRVGECVTAYIESAPKFKKELRKRACDERLDSLVLQLMKAQWQKLLVEAEDNGYTPNILDTATQIADCLQAIGTAGSKKLRDSVLEQTMFWSADEIVNSMEKVCSDVMKLSHEDCQYKEELNRLSQVLSHKDARPAVLSAAECLKMLTQLLVKSCNQDMDASMLRKVNDAVKHTFQLFGANTDERVVTAINSVWRVYTSQPKFEAQADDAQVFKVVEILKHLLEMDASIWEDLQAIDGLHEDCSMNF